jgi:hypothetical protein
MFLYNFFITLTLWNSGDEDIFQQIVELACMACMAADKETILLISFGRNLQVYKLRPDTALKMPIIQYF